MSSYGLASARCKANIARARELIAAPVAVTDPPAEHDDADLAASAAADHRPPCPCCGGRMIIVETFQRGGAPRGAIARSHSQGHDAMTLITASSHLAPAGNPASRVALLSSRRLPPHALCRRSGQNRPVDRRRGAKLTTAIVDPPPNTPASGSPARARAPSNPHRRQTALTPRYEAGAADTHRSRKPSSIEAHRRNSSLLTHRWRGRIRTPGPPREGVA
jgi:hypothetical protein